MENRLSSDLVARQRQGKARQGSRESGDSSSSSQTFNGQLPIFLVLGGLLLEGRSTVFSRFPWVRRSWLVLVFEEIADWSM